MGFKRSIKVGDKWYNYHDADAYKSTAKARAKKLRAQGYLVVIRPYTVPFTGGHTWHIFKRRK